MLAHRAEEVALISRPNACALERSLLFQALERSLLFQGRKQLNGKQTKTLGNTVATTTFNSGYHDLQCRSAANVAGQK